jgi:hypothetical protein
MDVKRRHGSIGARAILDDDGFAERGTQLVGDDATNRVAGAASSEHGYDGDWL